MVSLFSPSLKVGQSSCKDQTVTSRENQSMSTSVDRYLDDHFVEREGAGLVRAEHVHACHLLNRRETRDDGAVLGQRPRAHRERGRRHNLDGKRDGRDEHNNGEGERFLNRD
jgi:hypothetical protein